MKGFECAGAWVNEWQYVKFQSLQSIERKSHGVTCLFQYLVTGSDEFIIHGRSTAYIYINGVVKKYHLGQPYLVRGHMLAELNLLVGVIFIVTHKG